MPTTIKQKLLQYCYDFVQLKQERLQITIEDAQSSLGSESQSTAGDKHDTSRAMMHLEIEKKSAQLEEIIKLKRVLNQIDIKKSSSVIGLGSIIKTNKNSFFIAINGGKATIDGTEFIIISLASPLAQKIKSLKVNSKVQILEKNYVIERID